MPRTPTPILVRECTPDDWRVWRDVRRRALAESPLAFGSTLAAWSGAGDTEERWRARLEGVPLNVVAFDGTSPVAQASATPPDEDGLVETISVWVDPAHRGRGVGGALVSRIEQWAGANGAVGVKLSVKQDNRRAIAFYGRLGFADGGVSPDSTDERLMTKRLRNDAS